MIDIYIAEFLRKENEKYHLQRIGFMKDFPSERSALKTFFEGKNTYGTQEEFIVWRKEVLHKFYTSKDFSSFFLSHLDDKEERKMLDSLIQHKISIIKKEIPLPEIDKQLAPEGKSLCYIFDDTDLGNIIPVEFQEHFPTASDVNNRCQRFACQNYPMRFERIVDRLRTNRPRFWEIFSEKLKNITRNVTKSMASTYSDDMVHNLWTDTGIDLRNYLNSERFKKDMEARELAAFTTGIVKNKLHELFRKEKGDPHQWVENWDAEALPYDMADETEAHEDVYELADIDLHDERECQMALSCILCDKKHPLYRRLTEGLEDKVEYMMEHYVQDKAYDEIVKLHFPLLNAEEQKKKCDKIRQDVTRVKTKLKERFEDMLKNR